MSYHCHDYITREVDTLFTGFSEERELRQPPAKNQLETEALNPIGCKEPNSANNIMKVILSWLSLEIRSQPQTTP